MSFDRIILSTNEDPRFIEFWPLAAKAWKKMFNVPVTLAVITNRTENDGLIHDLKQHGDVVLMRSIPGIPTGNLAKVARYIIAGNYPAEVCMIEDLDILPLSRDYYLNITSQREKNTLGAVGHEVYEGTPHEGKFPASMTHAEGYIFREIWGHTPDNFRHMFAFDHKEDITKHPTLFSDESLFRALIFHWLSNNNVKKITQIKRNAEWQLGQAVDRTDWFIDKEKLYNGGYAFAHMLRPMHQYKKEIQPLVDYINDLPKHIS